MVDLITDNGGQQTLRCDDLSLNAFAQMNPDQSDAVSRIISSLRTSYSKDSESVDAPRTVRELLRVLEVPDMTIYVIMYRWYVPHVCSAMIICTCTYVRTPHLLSMWLCFCVDKGFQDDDFQHFDCEQWLDAAEELDEEFLNVEPHVVLVAQHCRV